MSADPGGDEIAERFADAVGLEHNEQNVKLKNGRTNQANKKEPQLERTVLTNWKKKAQNMKKGAEEKSSGMTSTGAVRPPPEAWNRNSNSSRDIPDFGYDTFNEDPYVGSVGGRVGDTKLLKIGLGVFGGIALILGTMLSYFYIQKKNKDDKHKRQRAKNQSPGGGRGGSPNNIPYPGHPFPGNYPYPGAYEQAGYDHQLPPGPYEGIPGPVGPCQPGQPGQYPPQYPYEAQFYPYMQQYDEFAVPPQYMTPEQYYEQQAYDQNYYNMCQDYIQKQRQLQYESHTMTQPGYSAVMDYVDKIGDNLKTPKAKNRVKDGNPQGTPHPIITRRGSMKSLAQSEASCWTEDLSDKEDDDKKSLDRSEMCCGQSENDKNDGASQKSDSAYGSRGSIQSPNGSPQDLKDLPVVNSSHMFREEEQDMSHTSDHDSQKLDDSAHDTSHDESPDEPKVLKTMIRQKSDNNTKLRKVTTFKSISDSEE